jgi:uncharacterized membrane protein
MIRRVDEQGMVTAFVVSITAALLLFVGLVLDGGYLLAARREAIDEADAAARAAAQSIATPARSGGSLSLDPARAQAAVDRFLAPTGHHGVAVVNGEVVLVTVSFPQRMVILGVGGLAARTVTGKGTAHVVRGIKTAEGP